jgi:hypothetical protein
VRKRVTDLDSNVPNNAALNFCISLSLSLSPLSRRLIAYQYLCLLSHLYHPVSLSIRVSLSLALVRMQSPSLAASERG